MDHDAQMGIGVVIFFLLWYGLSYVVMSCTEILDRQQATHMEEDI